MSSGGTSTGGTSTGGTSSGGAGSGGGGAGSGGPAAAGTGSGGAPPPCTGNADCADGNVCANDTCVSVQCTKTFVAKGTDCGNGTVCDLCQYRRHGRRQEKGTDCGNGTVCDRTETCVGDGTVCDAMETCVGDGNGTVCDAMETCVGNGNGVPGTPPQVDDANACTVDDCDPMRGVARGDVRLPLGLREGQLVNRPAPGRPDPSPRFRPKWLEDPRVSGSGRSDLALGRATVAVARVFVYFVAGAIRRKLATK